MNPYNFQFNTALKPCMFCGGGDGSSGQAHTANCPFYWHHPTEDVVLLRLNEYQAANLLRLLNLVWTNQITVPNPGDWYGEIPMQLAARMIERGWLTSRANDGSQPAQDP